MKSNDKDFICFKNFYCHINKKMTVGRDCTPHDSIACRTTFRNFTWSVCFLYDLSQSLRWLYRRLRPLFFTTLLQLIDVCRHLCTALLKSSNSISTVLTSNLNYFMFQSFWCRFAAVLGSLFCLMSDYGDGSDQDCWLKLIYQVITLFFFIPQVLLELL